MTGADVIVSKVMGGLGNQLFQYCIGRALAIERGVPMALHLGWFAPSAQGRNFRHKYLLDAFMMPSNMTTIDDPRTGRIGRLRSRWANRKALKNLYLEPSFAHDPEVHNVGTDAFLLGYWQSEKYFVDYEETIRSDLKLIAPVSVHSRQAGNAIDAAGKDSVSIHVRRGDYVKNPAAAKVHGTLSPDYYREAIARMESKLDHPQYFLFSDDPDWCRGELDLPESTTIIDHTGGATAHEDLHLMSRCSNHVIANSTFSWWGAWIGGGYTIAPKQWFLNPEKEGTDLIPGRWERI